MERERMVRAPTDATVLEVGVRKGACDGYIR